MSGPREAHRSDVAEMAMAWVARGSEEHWEGKIVPHLRWSQALPLPCLRPWSADNCILLVLSRLRMTIYIYIYNIYIYIHFF